MAELEEIIDHINHGRNFLLSGGAGSGKTYSLVQVIRKVIEDYSSSQIMCITYTNAAVREIQERVDHHNLTVRTIHEFLWAQIKNYQKGKSKNKKLKEKSKTLETKSNLPLWLRATKVN